MIQAMRIVDQLVALFCKWAVIACLLGLFFLLLLAVIVRLVPFISISGYDEVVEWLFVWLTFRGAVALWREGALYRVIVVEAMVPSAARYAIDVMNQIIMLAVALVMVVKGYEFLSEAGEITPFLGIDKGYWYVAVPFSGALMACYSLVGLWRALKGERTLEDSAILG